MSTEEVLQTFEYWQKQGVARVVNGKSMCIEFGDFSVGRRAHGGGAVYRARIQPDAADTFRLAAALAA